MTRNQKEMPSLLTILEYEKLSFDNIQGKSLFSKSLPLKLFMGRLSESSHRRFILNISMGGQNYILHSNDERNLHQFIENAYVSSWLNGRTKTFHYCPIGYDSFHSTELSCIDLGQSMIFQIDKLYSFCKENEELPDKEKKLYVIMISNLSDIPFFSDVLLEENQIELRKRQLVKKTKIS